MPSPLHPAVVHFPLVLAVLLPFLAVAALLVARRPGLDRAAWAAVAAVAVLLPLSAWAALATGQQEEEAVESVVAESLIGGHEEAAEGFLAASAVLSVIVLAGLAPGRVGRSARFVSVAAAAVVLALAFRVGGSGGQLVYTHGAAAAYVDGASGAGTPPALRGGEAAGEDEREGDEERR
ncbi:MAG: hypothetical protein Q8N53_23845 [Longimicrobiales bacterium]|nr:hypothetical protein [Longimicrobiales bacterium]